MNKLIHVASVDGVTCGFKNKLINGNFDIWQRATISNGVGYIAPDRWSFGKSSGTWTVSRGGSDGAISASGGNRYYLNITSTSVVGGYFLQPIEFVHTLQNKTVALTLMYNVNSGTNTGIPPYLRQSFGSGGSPSSYTDISATSDITDTYGGFTRRRLTYNLPSIAGKTLGTNNGTDSLVVIIPTAGTSNISYWAIQLEEGSVATDFEQRHVAQELALCQRYYEKRIESSRGLSDASGLYHTIPFLVEKRAVPTCFFGSNSGTNSTNDLTGATKTGVNMRMIIGGSAMAYLDLQEIFIDAEL